MKLTRCSPYIILSGVFALITQTEGINVLGILLPMSLGNPEQYTGEMGGKGEGQ